MADGFLSDFNFDYSGSDPFGLYGGTPTWFDSGGGFSPTSNDMFSMLGSDSFGLGSNFQIFDTWTGQMVDPSAFTSGALTDQQAMQQNAAAVQALNAAGGQGGPASSGGGLSNRDLIALALGIPTVGLGAAGLIQALSGGSSKATTTQQPNATQPSAAEQALQQGTLGGLQQALQFAYGGGGGMAGGGGFAGGTPQTTAQKGQHLFTQGMEGGQLNTYEVNGQKWDEWVPSTPGAQPPQGTPIRPFPGGAGGGGVPGAGGGGGVAGLLQARQPGEMAAFQTALARLGQPSPVEGLAPYLTQQVPALMQQQQGALQDALTQARMTANPLNFAGLGALGVDAAGINPQLATPLALAQMGAQGSGMLQGQLPSLDPAIQSRIGDVYAARQLDLDRYLDTALSGTLERARQQGFAGGAEVLREGTPGALMAPALAEAVRQRGTLAGQQAQSELDLAQQLPLLGSQLTAQRGNLINQQAQTRLGALGLGGQLEQGRIASQLGAGQGLQQAAAGFTTPASVALQGGLNLGTLNQNIIRLLGDIGQQGVGNQLGFLQSATAPLSVGGNLATQAANQRLLGAGSTTTQQQPFSLLNAFAPTGSLLGGVGGILSSLYGNQGSTLNVNMSGA